MENERLANTYNWFLNNPDRNPNMFELIEVLSQVSRCNAKNLDFASRLPELEIKRLLEKGFISNEEDVLVLLINDIKARVLSGKVLSYETEEFAKSLAGITFYIKVTEKQENRKYTYDNTDEFIKLLEMREEMMDIGDEFSDSMRKTLDFIEVHYKNNSRTIPTKYSIVERANKRYKDDKSRLMFMLKEVEPYIYPERVQELAEYCEKDVMLPKGVAFQAIIDLDLGMDFDSVLDKIRGASLSGWGMSEVLTAILMFAKNGPDFWYYGSRKEGQYISNDSLEFMRKRKEGNQVLHKKYYPESVEETE